MLKLVAEAHTSEQIAELLTISPRTVERHRENMMGKLGMRDRVAAHPLRRSAAGSSSRERRGVEAHTDED